MAGYYSLYIELITFITPYIIEDDEDMLEVTKRQRELINAYELIESQSIRDHLDSVMDREEVAEEKANSRNSSGRGRRSP